MKNYNKHYFILAILFILISIVSFVIPIEKTTAFYVTYAFTTIAFIIQGVIWKLTLGNSNSLTSKFLNISIFHVSIVYLFIQIILLIIFRFATNISTWIAVTANVLVICLSLIFMISTNIGTNEIERIDKKVQEKVFYIKDLQTNVELLANLEQDKDIKEKLAQLAEKIRFSDPMSNEQLVTIEEQISSKVNDLKASNNKQELITEINNLLDTRNKKCKLLK